MPSKGGSMNINLRPLNMNELLIKKTRGFFRQPMSAASLLPAVLGEVLSKDELEIVTNIIERVIKKKKNPQKQLNLIAKKYGSGTVSKLFDSPKEKYHY